MGSPRAAPIFLCGMMGAGKSTVGRQLAAALVCEFVDLDARLERTFGRSIDVLLGDEANFRRLERAVLRSLLAEPAFGHHRSVVATGGGVVLDPDNLADMQAHGLTVWLQVPLEVLRTRLCSNEETRTRPLLAEPGALDRLFAARRSSYANCAITVDADAPAALVVQRVQAALAATAP